MILNLLLCFFICFEFQKLFQLNFFFRLRCISNDYYNNLPRENSIAYEEITKIGVIDFFYLITIIIGIFTKNNLFFSAILIISIIQFFIFKTIKNKKIRRFFTIFDILSSISLLLIILTNKLILY